MTTDETGGVPLEEKLRRDAFGWLARRRMWFLTGLSVVAVGLALNWSWLTAIGAAPIILGLLPCAAMCAFGLCMQGGHAKPDADSKAAAQSKLRTPEE